MSKIRIPDFEFRKFRLSNFGGFRVFPTLMYVRSRLCFGDVKSSWKLHARNVLFTLPIRTNKSLWLTRSERNGLEKNNNKKHSLNSVCSKNRFNLTWNKSIYSINRSRNGAQSLVRVETFFSNYVTSFFLFFFYFSQFDFRRHDHFFTQT